MGLEAKCRGRWGGGEGEVKALLESHELILRGDIKRRIPISDLADVRVDGGDLRFSVASDKFVLDLGASQAQRWARKIATPPPSLAQKLGVSLASKVLVIGSIADVGLREALRGCQAAHEAEAQLSLAVVHSEMDLDVALESHGALVAGAPIWIVYQKGAKAQFGEVAVRRSMRAAGYRDNKVSAVSDELSATRYVALPPGR